MLTNAKESGKACRTQINIISKMSHLDKIKETSIINQHQIHCMRKEERMFSVMIRVVTIAQKYGQHEVSQILPFEVTVSKRLHKHVTD